MTSSVSLHRAWIRDIRRVARQWSADFEPNDWLVALQEVREKFLAHVLEANEELLWMVFSKTAPPETMASLIWNYSGRDVLAALKPKGYVRTPNVLSGTNGYVMEGTKDLLLRLPREGSTKEQLAMAVELLAAKRDRTQKLVDNAAIGVETIDKQIDEYNQLLLAQDSSFITNQ